jgi:hypothetical protein
LEQLAEIVLSIVKTAKKPGRAQSAPGATTAPIVATLLIRLIGNRGAPPEAAQPDQS